MPGDLRGLRRFGQFLCKNETGSEGGEQSKEVVEALYKILRLFLLRPVNSDVEKTTCRVRFSSLLSFRLLLRTNCTKSGHGKCLFNELAERGPMLCTAETSPLHYLPHLDPKSSSLQLWSCNLKEWLKYMCIQTPTSTMAFSKKKNTLNFIQFNMFAKMLYFIGQTFLLGELFLNPRLIMFFSPRTWQLKWKISGDGIQFGNYIFNSSQRLQLFSLACSSYYLYWAIKCISTTNLQCYFWPDWDAVLRLCWSWVHLFSCQFRLSPVTGKFTLTHLGNNGFFFGFSAQKN